MVSKIYSTVEPEESHQKVVLQPSSQLRAGSTWDRSSCHQPRCARAPQVSCWVHHRVLWPQRIFQEGVLVQESQTPPVAQGHCCRQSLLEIYRKLSTGQNSTSSGCSRFLSLLKAMEYFEPRTRKWSVLSEMDCWRSCTAVASHDSTIYLLGGEETDCKSPTGSRTVNRVTKFDAEKRSWSSGTSMLLARRWAGAIVVDETLYVVGEFWNLAK